MVRYRILSSFRWATLLTAAFLFAITASAQILTGDVTGRVLDPAGAVVNNASITIRNVGTGLSRTVTTNDDGEYTVTQLPPGTYEIVVEARGFNKLLAKDVQINVGTKQTRNFELKAGAVTETIEIAAGAALIETTKSDRHRRRGHADRSAEPAAHQSHLRVVVGHHSRSSPGR